MKSTRKEKSEYQLDRKPHTFYSQDPNIMSNEANSIEKTPSSTFNLSETLPENTAVDKEGCIEYLVFIPKIHLTMISDSFLSKLGEEHPCVN
jgi:hypothetical protein